MGSAELGVPAQHRGYHSFYDDNDVGEYDTRSLYDANYHDHWDSFSHYDYENYDSQNPVYYDSESTENTDDQNGMNDLNDDSGETTGTQQEIGEDMTNPKDNYDSSNFNSFAYDEDDSI
ncbi:unnamed protein product [Trichobilharzia regenti]|nr:unnamed protein product [Trichobilharzia regenti]